MAPGPWETGSTDSRSLVSLDGLLGPLTRALGPQRQLSPADRLVVAILCLSIPLGAGLAAYLTAFSATGPLVTAATVVAAMTVLLVAALGLAVRGHTRFAGVLAVFVTFLAWAIVIVFPTQISDVVAFGFAGIPLAASSLLLPAIFTAGLTAAAVSMVSVVAVDGYTQGLLAIATVVVGSFLTVGSHLRNRNRQELLDQADQLDRTQAWLDQAQRKLGMGAFHWIPGQDPSWSPHIYEMLGYDPDEGPLSMEEFAEHVHPEDRERFRRTFEQAGECVDDLEVEVRIERADGETIHAVWRAGIDDVHRARPVYVGAVQDVTERKRYEQVQRRMVGEQARSEALRRVVNIASHEFREPVRTAVTSAQRIERELQERVDQVEEPLADVLRAGRRLDQVTDGLVRLTESLARPIEFSHFDADQALDEAIHQLERRNGHGAITVERGDLPQVEADRGFLTMVFIELIENAIGHNDSDVTVRVDASRTGPAVRFTVSDDGGGFPEEYETHVLEPFARLEREGWVEHPGLGLTRVHRVVERHDGHVDLSSTPGEGTRVTFTIPDQRTDPLDTEALAARQDAGRA